MQTHDTICAIATAPGGAIGIIRLTGENAIAATARIFTPTAGKPLQERKGHTLTFGKVYNKSGEIIDEVLVSVFRSPHSYTGEEAVEISCHGSSFILRTILQMLIDGGCRLAEPGEFTRRAFLNGRMDLSQAEAVADLIASSTAANHRIAMRQMRGDFSKRLAILRERLLHLTSLLELELDFSDHEDLEFADRTQLDAIAAEVESVTERLANSFSTGNALKNGLPVAIVGSTNSGKSTLINALLHDERAIVSDIHGTTRDVIEDTYNIGGTLFRFIDTAGLRSTDDTIEQLGIERSWQKLGEAQIVLFVVDSTQAENQLSALASDILADSAGKHLVILFNKADLVPNNPSSLLDKYLSTDTSQTLSLTTLHISAKEGIAIDRLTETLVRIAQSQTESSGDVIVTNARHYAALASALTDIRRVRQGMSTGLSGDFIAQDLRECLFHLAEITGGTITTDEVLGTIFKHFCIGK